MGKFNCFGNSLEEIKREFEENERNRKRSYGNKQNYLYHEFLAFSPDDSDKLNLEVLQDLTTRYLELRAPNGLAAFVFHLDKHRHSHILLSSVELETGRSLRLTREEFETARKELQAYQLEKYPELKASVIDFDKEAEYTVTHAEQQIKARTGQASRKEELREELQKAFEEALSPEDFYSFLQKDLKLYERGGKIAGIEDDGKNYRLSTLGFDDSKIQELAERESRLDELNKLREHEEPSQEPLPTVTQPPEEEQEQPLA